MTTAKMKPSPTSPRAKTDPSPMALLDPNSRQVCFPTKTVFLTRREFALLEELLKQAQHTVTRTELFTRCFGKAYTGIERAIDVHIASLRRKLGEDTVKIRTIYGVGYRVETVYENKRSN